MMKMSVLARSPKLDDIFMDQEHNFQENELGDDLQKYTPKGIFSAQMGKEKDEEKQVLNTYL